MEEHSKDPTSYAKTGVFWDVQDYPILNLLDPVQVKLKIEQAVIEAGYSRDLSIFLWLDKNDDSDRLLQLYSASSIPITFRPKGYKLEMVHNMMVSISLWSFDNPAPANVMVLSRYIGNEMQEALEILHHKKYNILLSKPPEESDIFPCRRLNWLLNRISPLPLRTKKKPLRGDSSGQVRLFCSTGKVETRWDDFPKASQKNVVRPVSVYWDVEDSSILRNVDPKLTAESIRTAIRDKDYYGHQSICAFVDFDSVEGRLYRRFLSAGIILYEAPKGVKTIRSTMVATTILATAMNVAKASCMLLLSEDKGFETVVDALKKHHVQAGLIKPDVFLCMKRDSSSHAQEQKEWKDGSSQGGEQIELCSAD